MAWVRLDDGFPEHPKVAQAGDLAAWLFVCGLAYANRNLTDGFLPSSIVPRLTGLKHPKALAERLVSVGLWERREGGYQIHDYLDYQASARKISAEREQNASRVGAYRARRNGGSNGRVTPLPERSEAPETTGGNGACNGVVTPAPTPSKNPTLTGSKPLPGPDRPPPPTPSPANGAADAASDGKVSPLVGLSDGAREVVECWRAAHGKKKPPNLNPTQREKLERAVVEIGVDLLKCSATWSAERGIGEFDKAINAAYTARKRHESESGDATDRGAFSGAWNGEGRAAARPGAGSAGRPKRFAEYVIRDPAPS